MIAQTNSGKLVQLLQTLLLASTDAGAQVFVARTWPSKLSALPAIIVDPLYRETKTSLGKNAPQFDTVTTITVRGRVTAAAGPDDEGGLTCAEALETLKWQIERTLINAYPVMLTIEQFVRVDAEFTLSTDGLQNVGELAMAIAMGFYEGPEDFAPIDTSTLEEVAVYSDLVNVFDPQGTYSQTPFPAVPAPRTTGPDGRIEGGGLLIDTDPDD